MNLIPSNGVMGQLVGSVNDLPGVTQYISMVIEGDEEVASISRI